MKSSFSNTDCVNVEREILPNGTEIFEVTNTKYPGEDGPTFTRPEWNAFTKAVKAGEFDYPQPAALTAPQSLASELLPE